MQMICLHQVAKYFLFNTLCRQGRESDGPNVDKSASATSCKTLTAGSVTPTRRSTERVAGTYMD